MNPPPPPSPRVCDPTVAERLVLFASRTEQAIFVGSADGRVEWANEAACRLCGSSRDELLGRKLRLFPDDPQAQSAAAQHVGARFAAGEVARLEASLGARDGRTLWIELQVTPVPGASDGSSGWVAIARDVSERKQTEQALAESEERYRRLVEDSPEPAAVHAAGRLVYLNRAALALLGASSPEAVLGRSVFEFLHPDYHRLATERILKMEVVGDPAGPVVERLLRLDGSPVDVELAATPITWRGKPAIQLSGHALGRAASSEETERGRAPALDLSSLVLRLAPRLEDRIAPRAVVSLDLSEARIALRGSSAALEELICSLAAQVSASLPRGRGGLQLRSETRQLGAPELAAFVPRAGVEPGPCVVFDACAEAGALDGAALAQLFQATFAQRFPGRGPGLAGALALARAHGGALRVKGGDGAPLRITLALPAAKPRRRVSSRAARRPGRR